MLRQRGGCVDPIMKSGMLLVHHPLALFEDGDSIVLINDQSGIITDSHFGDDVEHTSVLIHFVQPSRKAKNFWMEFGRLIS